MGIIEFRDNLADRIDAARIYGEVTPVYNARRGPEPLAALVPMSLVRDHEQLLAEVEHLRAEVARLTAAKS